MKPYNNIRWRKYKLNENKLANMKDKTLTIKMCIIIIAAAINLS